MQGAAFGSGVASVIRLRNVMKIEAIPLSISLPDIRLPRNDTRVGLEESERVNMDNVNVKIPMSA